MKILAIGDFHGRFPERLKKLAKKADLILCTGDLGKADLARKQAFKKIENRNYKPSNLQQKRAYLQIYSSTLNILKRITTATYFIYGNVEMTDSEIKKLSRKIKLKLPLLNKRIKKIKNVQNISGKIKNIERISIAGYGYFVEKDWVKRFIGNDKKYLKEHRKEDEKARKFFRKLKYIDILIVHQPPFNILDKVTAKYAPKRWKGKHAGSEIILNYIKREKPKYVICGHIHEGKGEKNIGRTKVINLGEGGFKLINTK
ncbi:metallophosphoesterase [Candidatus Pacearchaeota archaeon]|nr:metallophosphoesterase [Candidatus Pacearchaeota archaeon]